ncbi:RDD family protein [Spongisporangium articulatum]|uniref:RDD family protein n=1 Tax=Spongisporangium articulatum TaxID=3362603 RepID=A0ABW8AJV5_9ACTN
MPGAASPQVEGTTSVGTNPVTGEAVVIDLRPATFITRGLALALDLFIMAMLMLLVSFVVLSAAMLDDAALAAILLVSELAVLIGYPWLLETFTRGRSVGKLAAGLRVVRDDGGPIRARQALIRTLLGVFDFYITSGVAAIFTSLLNSRGKRLGDLLAGTYVIRERARPEQFVPIFMPPPLAAWAAGADLGRIPDGLAVAARQFIGRSASLAPSSREAIGADLATRMRGYVSPPPPGNPPVEEYLRAVLAERRRRDHDRLARRAAERDVRRARNEHASVLTDVGSSLPR